MQRRARSPAWVVAAWSIVCNSCGGDYWLGGARGHSTGGVSSGPSDAGATATPRSLDGDVVLRNDDSLELPGNDAGACLLVGNGHAIRSEGTWTGHLTIRRCRIEKLGGGATPAISVDMSGSGVTTIEGSTFSASGAIEVTNGDQSSTTFNDNVILGDSTVPIDPSADQTIPAFTGKGDSPAPKLFQGNRIYRSTVAFASPNWLVGGDRDADSNVIVGLRGGMIFEATGLAVRGNYVHVMHLDGAGDEAAVQSAYGTVDTLLEHNVLRGGSWVFRGFGGEARFNEILDTWSVSWIYQPFENTKVHHNVFMECRLPDIESQAGIYLVNDRAGGIEIYNNTMDAGGPAMMLAGAAVAIDDGCQLASFRSNLVENFPFFRNDGGSAAVRPGITDSVRPPPVRLGYADYNLFFDPEADTPRNYAVSIPGKVPRDDGFGAHDAHAGGPVDEQVDPGKLGFSGDCFPWSDADIEASRVTVSQILSATRVAYTPVNGSAALSTGDPSDGAGNFIGAVGDGTTSRDLFGTFGK